MDIAAIGATSYTSQIDSRSKKEKISTKKSEYDTVSFSEEAMELAKNMKISKDISKDVDINNSEVSSIYIPGPLYDYLPKHDEWLEKQPTIKSYLEGDKKLGVEDPFIETRKAWQEYRNAMKDIGLNSSDDAIFSIRDNLELQEKVNEAFYKRMNS